MSLKLWFYYDILSHHSRNSDKKATMPGTKIFITIVFFFLLIFYITSYEGLAVKTHRACKGNPRNVDT